MKNIFAGAIAAATIGMLVASTPAQAGCRGCAIGAGVAAGIIGGALIAGAAANAAAAPVYRPAYAGGPRRGCYYSRDRVWDPAYGVWRRPRVLVCP